MSRSTKPIDPKTKQRYAELIGLGLSHPEAARVTGISERSGERLMAKPDYRKIAEDTTKRGRGKESEVAQVVRDLLTAVHADGTPDLPTVAADEVLVHVRAVQVDGHPFLAGRACN
jgi:hypothetical protein